MKYLQNYCQMQCVFFFWKWHHYIVPHDNQIWGKNNFAEVTFLNQLELTILIVPSVRWTSKWLCISKGSRILSTRSYSSHPYRKKCRNINYPSVFCNVVIHWLHWVLYNEEASDEQNVSMLNMWKIEQNSVSLSFSAVRRHLTFHLTVRVILSELNSSSGHSNMLPCFLKQCVMVQADVEDEQSAKKACSSN